MKKEKTRIKKTKKIEINWDYIEGIIRKYRQSREDIEELHLKIKWEDGEFREIHIGHEKKSDEY